MKGIRYVIAQTIGAYIACLLIYVQYRHVILVSLRHSLIAAQR